jgi:hypothetical protein
MAERLASEDFDDDLEDSVDDDLDGDEPEDDIDDEDSDNVGDPSVEINVEDLIHELEADGLVSRIDKEKNTRKRLEELMERKRAMRELEDFDDYEI